MTEVVPIIVMTKFPAAGRVKTRLTPALSPQQAADVHSAFLKHWVGRLLAIQSSASVNIFICYDPPETRELFQHLLDDVPACQFFAQSSGDLGDRLSAAAERMRQSFDRVVFVGVDSPDLPDDHLRQLLSISIENDVAVGPTDDGGYWSIAVARRVDAKRLFERIEWSSGRERAQTVERATNLGYTVGLGPTWDDVDHPADLARLIDRLSRSEREEDRRLLASLSFVPREKLT